MGELTSGAGRGGCGGAGGAGGGPRFGIWAPVWGSFLARRGSRPEEVPEAAFSYNAGVVRAAEERGFATALILDHWLNGTKGFDCPILESVTTTAALAAVTSRIELMLAYRPAAHHPAVMAKQGATIDHISGGRFAFNVVSGWYEEEHHRYGVPFPDHDARHAMSAEAVDIIRGLWTQPSFTYQGRFFQVRDAMVSPPPVCRPHPPIYFGGESEAGKETAARVADVYLMNGRPVEEAARLVDEVRELAARRGNGRVRFGMSAFVVCRPGRGAAAAELERLLSLAAGHTGPPGAVDPEAVHKRTGGSRGVGTNGGIRAGLVGTPEEIAERIEVFCRAGIETFLLQFHPVLEGLHAFADEVMPLCRGMRVG